MLTVSKYWPTKQSEEDSLLVEWDEVGSLVSAAPGLARTAHRRDRATGDGVNERVYRLFKLTPAEIKIVEESTKYGYEEV